MRAQRPSLMVHVTYVKFMLFLVPFFDLYDLPLYEIIEMVPHATRAPYLSRIGSSP
jgi:hypothetical protein